METPSRQAHAGFSVPKFCAFALTYTDDNGIQNENIANKIRSLAPLREGITLAHADLIYERELTTQRPAGGHLTMVRVVQIEGGGWHIQVKVSWRDGHEFTIGHFDRKQIKVYLRLSAAIRHIILDYGYTGPLTILPKAGQSHAKSF